MKITREDVLHVAELAHLELAEAEVDTYRQQLDSILSYIEKLNQLDTAQVQPMAQALATIPGKEQSVWRDDAARPCDVAEHGLAAAPDTSGRYLRVPKVIDR